MDKEVRRAFEECSASFAALMEAAGGAAKYPALSQVARSYGDLVLGIDRARGREDIRAAISRFVESRPFSAEERLRAELSAAASATGGDPAHSKRVRNALRMSVDAVRRFFDPCNAAIYDVALLRVRTEGRLHTCLCRGEATSAPEGAKAKLVTIYPDREPSVRDLTLGGNWGLVRSRLAYGMFKAGNSGSPIFIEGRLAGIVTRGVYPKSETPGDTFDEGAFVRIDDIRAWLARIQLGAILAPATHPSGL
jgi:hypothetical protein